ncbi:MAG: TraR/DksA family transcriptional regulator [Gammaproteobacteria bacterium]|nr:TraR/DksA family transcriptional regulator [Gammaproteobacteria bacterium]
MPDTEHFKNRLIALEKEVSRRLDTIDKDIRHEDMSADWSEQATERENDEVLESLGISEDRKLLMINQALQRIEAGTYFTCLECGEPIPSARLELLPFSSLCVDCAEYLE